MLGTRGRGAQWEEDLRLYSAGSSLDGLVASTALANDTVAEEPRILICEGPSVWVRSYLAQSAVGSVHQWLVQPTSMEHFWKLGRLQRYLAGYRHGRLISDRK